MRTAGIITFWVAVAVFWAIAVPLIERKKSPVAVQPDEEKTENEKKTVKEKTAESKTNKKTPAGKTASPGVPGDKLAGSIGGAVSKSPAKDPPSKTKKTAKKSTPKEAVAKTLAKEEKKEKEAEPALKKQEPDPRVAQARTGKTSPAAKSNGKEPVSSKPDSPSDKTPAKSAVADSGKTSKTAAAKEPISAPPVKQGKTPAKNEPAKNNGAAKAADAAKGTDAAGGTSKKEPVKPPKDKPSGLLTTTVVLHVPADAKVTLGGAKTNEPGTVRTFAAGLPAGKTIPNYKVDVQVQRNGKTLSQSKTITLRAGQTHTLKFEF